MLPVPPTSNELTPSQRLRLMRSTRKLGEMLGTTPIINSSSSSPAPSASVSLHHSSSLRRPDTNSQRKTRPLPRPLVLSFQAVPAPMASPKHSPTSSPLSPISRSFNRNRAASSSSITSRRYEEDSLQTRRKRMAKLTRTLGENIPPELVNHSHPRPPRPRSASGTGIAAAFTVAVIPPEPTSAEDDVLLALPQKGLLPRSSPSLSRSSSLQTPSSPSLVSRRSRRRNHDRGSSLGLQGLHLQKVALPPPSSGRKSSDSEMSIQSADSEPGTYYEKRTYRKQAGWSGEWNRQDMQEVMNRLRGLKAS